MTKKNHKRLSRIATRLGIAGIALAATLGIAACGSDDDDSGTAVGGGGEIDLVAYSTPQQAFEEGLIPAFQDTDAGSGVEFSTSFGASGDQRRAVEAGQPADLVDFSLEPDMLGSGRRRPGRRGLEQGPDQGHRQQLGREPRRPRPGNPEGIESFDDLLTKDVEIITPNPATSGGAKWNIMAIYGSQIEAGQVRAGGARRRRRRCSRRPRSSTTAPATRCRRSPAARATC